jgi:hypothetical protein
VDETEAWPAQHEQGNEAAKRDDCSERELPRGEGRAGREINPRNGGEWSSAAKWKGPVEDSEAHCVVLRRERSRDSRGRRSLIEAPPYVPIGCPRGRREGSRLAARESERVRVLNRG